MPETYRLQILFDDSKVKKLLTMLERFNGTLGSSSGSGSSGSNNNSTFKNLAKLGAIAVGIGSMVVLLKKISSMLVESSPMLQGMLKLFNTTVMFILRPIADFIGFFLKPILVYLLRNIAIPMYQKWGPIMRNLGTWLGSSLTDTLPKEGINSTFMDIISGGTWKEDIDNAGKFFTEFIPNTFLTWAGITKSSAGTSAQEIREIGGTFRKSNKLLRTIMGGFVQDTKGPFHAIANFFQSVWVSISEILKPAWDALVGFIEGIIDFFKGIWDFITNGASSLFGGDGGSNGGGRSPGKSMGNTSTTTIENVYVTAGPGTNTANLISEIEHQANTSKGQQRYNRGYK